MWLTSALSILRCAEREPLLTRWRALRDDPVHANGAVDLELDEMLPDDESVAAFLRLARATREHYASRGDTMSGDELTEIVGMPEIMQFEDRPMTKHLENLDRLIRLIEG